MKRARSEEQTPNRASKKVRQDSPIVVCSDAYDPFGDEMLIKVLSGPTYNIRILDLSYASLTDKGAAIVAKFLQDNHKISLINLIGNQIEEDGYAAIAKALSSSSSLGFLHLNNQSFKIGISGPVILETAVINSENIVYATYRNQSSQAAKILANRARLANAAVAEWAKYHNSQKLNELPYHLLRTLNLYRGAILTKILIFNYKLDIQEALVHHDSFVSQWAITANSQDVLRHYGIVKNIESAHLPAEIWSSIYSYVSVTDIKFEKSSQNSDLISNSDMESEEAKGSPRAQIMSEGDLSLSY
jgi:hypothetical protein